MTGVVSGLGYAVERIRETSLDDWTPYDELPGIGAMDPLAEQKYVAAAKLCSATFNGVAGRQTLDWMIQNFLLQMSRPDAGDDAMFRDGQANVVKQILY